MIYLLGICLLITISGYLSFLWHLWLVDGTLDSPFFLLLGGGALVLVGIGIRHSYIWLLWLMIYLMGGGSILYAALDNYYEKNSIKRRYLEDITILKRRVELNAADWRALQNLAEAYRKLEMYDEAIQAYKDAIRLEPPEVMQLRNKLNDALDLRNLGKMNETLICPYCEQETPSRRKRCIHCGKLVRFDLKEFIAAPNAYSGIARFAILSLAILAIMMIALPGLPIDTRITLAALCVAACVFLIWRVIMDDEK